MHLFRLCLAVGLLSCAALAHAVCLPVPHNIYVGTDAQCDTTSIQTAIDNAVCPGTNIVVTGELTYANQAIAVNKAVNIVGSTESCNSPPVVCDPEVGCGSTPPAKIAIAGDGANPVFYVTPSGSVGFSNLAISGGKGADNSATGGGGIRIFAAATQVTLRNVELSGNSGDTGGGIGIYGDGSLTLDGVSIHDNQAISGGGVSAISSYIGQIDLEIVDDPQLPSTISNNRATADGGGIYATGATHLQAVAMAPGRITIAGNQAGNTMLLGTGGGLFYGGTRFMDLGLPGTSIAGNQATGNGGGIFLAGSIDGNSILRLFSTQAQSPTQLFGNSANLGGGLMVNGSNGSTHTTACLFDASITNNSVTQAGSAAYVGSAARLIINPDNDPDCSFGAVAALGAVHCDPATLNCNRIALNQAPGINGSIVYFAGAAHIDAQRVHVQGNNSSHVVFGQYANSGASIAFRQCLFDGNTATGELVRLNGASATFDGCTIADDAIGASHVFAADTGLNLIRSIVREAPTVPIYDPSATPNVVAGYAMFSGPALPTDSTVVYADPQFLDSAHSDYHLQATSPALDFAPATTAGAFDFDGNPRVADLPGINNLSGPQDLGAFEYPLPDHIFSDGFQLPP